MKRQQSLVVDDNDNGTAGADDAMTLVEEAMSRMSVARPRSGAQQEAMTVALGEAERQRALRESATRARLARQSVARQQRAGVGVPVARLREETVSEQILDRLSCRDVARYAQTYSGARDVSIRQHLVPCRELTALTTRVRDDALAYTALWLTLALAALPNGVLRSGGVRLVREAGDGMAFTLYDEAGEAVDAYSVAPGESLDDLAPLLRQVTQMVRDGETTPLAYSRRLTTLDRATATRASWYAALFRWLAAPARPDATVLVIPDVVRSMDALLVWLADERQAPHPTDVFAAVLGRIVDDTHASVPPVPRLRDGRLDTHLFAKMLLVAPTLAARTDMSVAVRNAALELGVPGGFDWVDALLSNLGVLLAETNGGAGGDIDTLIESAQSQPSQRWRRRAVLVR